MNILLTGCAGFIGSRTTKLLLERGDTVTGIDALNDASYSAEVKKSRLQNLLGTEGFRFKQMDITFKQGVYDLFQSNKFDAVINLAALAGVRASLENPWSFLDVNVGGTLNLLEACVKNRVNKFVVASSSSVYGGGQHEAASEEMVTDYPLTQYGATKKAVEVLCYSYHNIYGLDISALRYFTVYGENGRPDMSLYRFIEGIKNDREIEVFGDGTQKRDFTYVDDIAAGTVASLQGLGFEAINLGNNNPVTLNYVIHLIENELGKVAKIKYSPRNKADVLINYANIRKAKRLLDWEPKVKIEEGIKRTVAWHLVQKSSSSP